MTTLPSNALNTELSDPSAAQACPPDTAVAPPDRLATPDRSSPGLGSSVRIADLQRIPDPQPNLTTLGFDILVARLVAYGNDVGPQQAEALRTLLRGMTTLAFGQPGRIAFPLPTGAGKTQAVVAWCEALHRLGLLGTASVTISATKVEALCEIKRDLVGVARIPSDQVGLLHSYAHDPEAVHAGKPGSASEPSDLDACHRPILLATHERGRGGDMSKFNRYKGQPRSLVVWDESLLVSEARSTPVSGFTAMSAALEGVADRSGQLAPLLRRWRGAIHDEISAQASGRTPSVLTLPQPIDPTRLEEEVRGFMKRRHTPGIRQMAKEFLAFLSMATEPLTVALTDQGDGLIAYRVAVPEELDRVAVLDASYPIRELCLADTTVRSGLDTVTTVKRYDRVTINVTGTKGSGRDAVKADLQRFDRDRSFYRPMLAKAVRTAGPNANVLVFTFRQRDRRDLDYVEVLRQDLRDQGLTPDERVGDLPRVSFLTWGDETSLSAFKTCTHVVFVGVLHRGHIDLAAALAGQSGSLMLRPDRARIYQTEVSEVAHVLYQAMSRGSCRVAQKDQASSMTVWLSMTNHDLKHVRPLLDHAAPGLCWRHADADEATPLIRQIRRYLSQVPATMTRVSTKTLKAACDATGMKTEGFQRVLRDAIRGMAWGVDGRSLIRL